MPTAATDETGNRVLTADRTALRQSAFRVMAALLSTSLVFLTTMTSLIAGEIFTSSDKILELANQETALLDALQHHINAEYDNLKALSA